VARGFSRISRRLGVPDDVPSSVDRGWAHADLAVDTLDAPSFATRGTYGRVSLIASREELGASDNYTRLEGQFYQPLTFGKNTIVPRVSASLKVGDGDVPLYDQMPLGGFLNLSGLPRGALFGQNAALAQMVYYRKLGELTPGIGSAIYGGFSVEAGEVWADARDFNLSDAIFSGSVFLGADTLIGALYFGVGVAEGGDAAIYLQLGSLFGQGREQR
jgi:NTE family protein